MESASNMAHTGLSKGVSEDGWRSSSTSTASRTKPHNASSATDLPQDS